MCHEKRAEWFPYLEEKLGNVPFLVDKGGPGDPENLGVWGNCKRSWLAFDPEAEWHFVLQDDSIICQDFYEHLNAVLDTIGEQDFIVSLYAGGRYRNKIANAIRRKCPHIIENMILNENALGMRTKHIQEMVDYCDSRDAVSDRYIQSYGRRRGLLVYSPIPSLIDHRPEPSLYRELYKKAYPDSVRSAVWFADNKAPDISLGTALEDRLILGGGERT